jgi:hypothetical protein
VDYVMTDLERLSGLKARTIREYIRLEYVPPPVGHGMGAVYSEEHAVRVVAIARMRAQGEGWDTVAERLTTWSLAKLRAFNRRTEPKPPAPEPAPAPAPPAPRESAPALEGEPVARNLPPRGAVFDESTELDVAIDPDGELPGASLCAIANVLPGLAIVLRHDAPPLVKRIAAEILAKYGVNR